MLRIGQLIANLSEAQLDAHTFGRQFLKSRNARPDRDGVVVAMSRFGEIHYRPADTDLRVLRDVFVRGDYDLSKNGKSEQMRVLHERYEQMIAAGETPVIIDAGANIGAASIWFGELFPKAKIAAVEPDPANAVITRRNAAARENMRVIEAAIGAKPGAVKLQSWSNQGWGSRTERSETGVPIVTVPELVALFPDGRLFIVKIDIEGFEADLFSQDVEWAREAAAVFIEPHDWMFPGRGTSQSLQKVLVAQGRELLVVGENLVFV